MATKHELIQAVNTAFSGPQKNTLLQMLDLLADGEIAASRLPIATETTVGVVSISTGLEVDSAGAVSVAT